MVAVGALPDFEIQGLLIDKGCIRSVRNGTVQPASLDVTLSREACTVEGMFLPRAGQSVRSALELQERYPFDLDRPLHPGQTLCVRLENTFQLPRTVHGYANPKSSTGRNDITAQIICDGVEAYDSLPDGYAGEVWELITPHSYPVIFRESDALSQVRFFDADTRMNTRQLRVAYKRYGLMYFDESSVPLQTLQTGIEDGRLVFTLDLRTDIVGYRARFTGKTLDFSKPNHHSREDFFEPIRRSSHGTICIREGEFALLRTREAIRVPPGFAAEVEALDSRSGHFVAHKAGFIDGGYGFGRKGEEKGLPITLEVRAVAGNITLHDGQRICRVTFERLRYPSQNPYHGNYTVPRMLPKQFRVA